jgi:hypothetical protein
MPLPQPISWGSISQGMPLLRTKRMPVRAARSGTGGRPPFGLRRRFGRSGAIRAHNLSPTNVAATIPVYNGAISRPVVGCGFVRRSKNGPTSRALSRGDGRYRLSPPHGLPAEGAAPGLRVGLDLPCSAPGLVCGWGLHRDLLQALKFYDRKGGIQ